MLKAGLVPASTTQGSRPRARRNTPFRPPLPSLSDARSDLLTTSSSFSLCVSASAHSLANTKSPAGGIPRAIRSQAERGVRLSSTTRYPAAAATSLTMMHAPSRRTARIHATTLESGSCGPTKSAFIPLERSKSDPARHDGVRDLEIEERSGRRHGVPVPARRVDKEDTKRDFAGAGRGGGVVVVVPCRTGICDGPCLPDKTVTQWRRICVGVRMASLL
ncbi:hypothetical protein BJY52DRAFT_1189792 [Lactarius psammicola]|nr:hypothetical protein BJY52DRAFT_1189792 [Lactarius psammicola]